MDAYQQYIHQSKYARWLETEKRRETFEETVDRYVGFFCDSLNPEVTSEIKQNIMDLEIMPSMRAFWSAGEALKTNNIAGFNCSYLPIDSLESFSESLYILASGTGVGFSVEKQYIDKLPKVPDSFVLSSKVNYIDDSKEGWADALYFHLNSLYSGVITSFNYTKIRPKGSRLLTMGGRASGPEPLKQLIDAVTDIFRQSSGRKLKTLECHDIMCYIGMSIVSGGVRRSALISLSDFDDEDMREAKSGNWYYDQDQRSISNNSAIYHKPNGDKLESFAFLKEFSSLIESGSGERGLFSRSAAKLQAGKNGRRDTGYEFGTNPCCEIILRPYQFCNLTEVICRENDSEEDLSRKIEYATILGTLQAKLTDFPYLRDIWKQNTEDEALLGVSLTGIQDCLILQDPDVNLLTRLKNVAIQCNKKYAKILDVKPATAITCIKPSGTVSQLVNCSSGLHARFAKSYWRNVRNNKDDPISSLLINQGIPYENPLIGPDKNNYIFKFPMRFSEKSITVDQQTAINQLEIWKKYAIFWCEHKPSVTIYVKEDEWVSVANWVYSNIDLCSGISFLPEIDDKLKKIYSNMPFEPKEFSEKEWNSFVKKIDFSKLSDFEYEDKTTGSQNLACTSGQCEI